MSKIYVAARYGRMKEMQSVHAALVAAGHEPTSQWVTGKEETEGKTEEQAAIMDVEDVDRADLVLLFSDEKSYSSTGGGRFFEMGYAHGKGKPVVTVGPMQIIFHHLPDMKCFYDLFSAIQYINEMKIVS